MKSSSKVVYTKRTQKDYPLSFKLAVIREVASGAIGNRAAMRKYGIQGHGTITEWRRKYGNFSIDYQSSEIMRTPQQKIFELEQKVRILEKEKAFLEEQMINACDKANILDQMVLLAEQELGIDIRKKSSTEQLATTRKKTKNQ